MFDLQQIFRVLLTGVMLFMGVLHFIRPDPFVKIIPKTLPYPLELVYISGFFEILGGVGLLIPQVSSYAAWGLIALYIAIFPANINMAINRISIGRKPASTWILWARLPVQLLLIAWAWWYT